MLMKHPRDTTFDATTAADFTSHNLSLILFKFYMDLLRDKTTLKFYSIKLIMCIIVKK